jgi:hypothetical protein
MDGESIGSLPRRQHLDFLILSGFQERRQFGNLILGKLIEHRQSIRRADRKSGDEIA